MAEINYSFFELSLDLFCVTDLKGVIERCNRSWFHTLGWKKEELKGHAFFDFIHPDDRAVLEKHLANCAPDLLAGNIDVRIRKRGGGFCDCRWSIATDLHHQVLHWVGRDITEQRLALESLNAAKRQHEVREKFFRATLDALPCAVSYLDVDCRYAFVNSTFNRWFGTEVPDCLGRTVSEVLGESVFNLIKEPLSRGLRGEFLRFDRSMPYRTGPRDVQITYVPDLVAGEVHGVYAVIEDVSPVAAAKRAIQEKEEEVSRILNSLPPLVSYWDRDLRNVLANESHLEFFGKTPAELKGRKMDELLPPEVMQEDQLFIQAALRGEPQAFERDMRNQRGENQHGFVQLLPDFHEGTVRGLLVIATDLTRIKELEKEKKLFEARLVAASKLTALGEMASGIAHEINNPLAIITGKTALLRQASSSGRLSETELQSAVDAIEATAFRIAKIIESLHIFSSSASQSYTAKCKVRDILATVLDLSRSRISSRGIDLKTVIAEDATEVFCRSHDLAQILMTLLNNSIDALERVSKKAIFLGVRHKGARVEFRVTDSGTKIEDAVAAKMMQPFFTTKPVGKGTGLGLSIASGLAKSNGGALYFDDKAAETTFVLEVPASFWERDAFPK